MIKLFAAASLMVLAVGIANPCPDRLPDRPRRNSCRREIRLQGRISRPGRSGEVESDRERRGLCRRVRPGRNVHRARRRQGPVGADASRRRADKARPRHGRSRRWHAQPQAGVDGLRHRAAQGEERDPVHRRRACRPPIASPRGCLSKGIAEGKSLGKLAIDDMPHMALVATAGSDSIITNSANAASAYATGHKTAVNAMGVYADRTARSVRRPQGRNHHQSRQAPAQHGHRHRHQYRSRGCHAGRDDRAYPPPRRL